MLAGGGLKHKAGEERVKMELGRGLNIKLGRRELNTELLGKKG